MTPKTQFLLPFCFGVAITTASLHAARAQNPVAPTTLQQEKPNARLELYRANELVRHENTGGKLTPAQESEILERNQEGLKILRDALKMPFEPQPLNTDLTVPFESGVRYRNLARFLALASRVQLRAGNLDGAANSALDIMRMAHLIQKGGGLFINLTGQALEAGARRTLREAMPKWDAANAKNLAREMETMENSRRSWAQMLATHDKLSRLELTNQIAQMFPDEANRKAVITRYDELMLWQIAQSQTPYLLSEARGKGLNLDKGEVEDEEENENEEDEAPAAQPDPNTVAETLFKVTGNIFDGGRFNFERNRVANSLLMTQLALRAFELENQREAKSLDELVPKYLQRVPIDPFNLEESLQWKERDGKWILYSIGPDGLDDGGWPGPNDPKTGKPHTYIENNHRGDIVANVHAP